MSKANYQSSDCAEPPVSEGAAVSVRTSISLTRFIRELAAVRVSEGGFPSESAYLAELVRRDAQTGIVAPRINTRKWADLLKAA